MATCCLEADLDLRQARQLARAGRLSIEDLLDLLEDQDRLRRRALETIRRLSAENECLKQRLEQYEPEVTSEPTPGQPPEKPSVSYSLATEEKRRRQRHRKKKSPGRRPTEAKWPEVERYENVVPAGWRLEDCALVRQRCVWRLEEGRAMQIGYRIYRAPGESEPGIPGVPRRCEYGIEILVVLAYLVYVIGISLHKACAVLGFFCQLPLRRSQADALLRQLAQHWEAEFDTLCDLLTHAAIVYADETGWKVGQDGCSLWAFVTEQLRLLRFGCRKDGATLESILPSARFHGILVSDDAAVYDRYAHAQKCWAHLLRKIIRLAVLYPRRRRYQRFLDELLQLYYDAKRAAADHRLGDQGRRSRVADLEGRLAALCLKHGAKETADQSLPEREFANLVEELADLLAAEQLFTFVLEPRVEATNNVTERQLRNPALERKAGRTNKTPTGAQRRSVIVSILETLRANLPAFTFASVVQEIRAWMENGVSLLDKMWEKVSKPSAASAPNTS
jgi:transposase